MIPRSRAQSPASASFRASAFRPRARQASTSARRASRGSARLASPHEARRVAREQPSIRKEWPAPEPPGGSLCPSVLNYTKAHIAQWLRAWSYDPKIASSVPSERVVPRFCPSPSRSASKHKREARLVRIGAPASPHEARRVAREQPSIRKEWPALQPPGRSLCPKLHKSTQSSVAKSMGL